MTMTLEDIPTKLNELDLHAPREVFEAISAAIRERDRLRGDVDGLRDCVERAEAELVTAYRERDRMFLDAREWATRFGEMEARAERAEAELAAIKDENAQLRDVLADRDMDREMAAHANKELAAIKARIQWQQISTAPKDGTFILVLDADGDVRHAKWDKPGWWCGYDCYGNDAFVERPTHWTPLPPPPKGEE